MLFVQQDKDTGVELELEEQMPLLEWLANNYKNFGTTLEIITDRSQVHFFFPTTGRSINKIMNNFRKGHSFLLLVKAYLHF
jgi:peptide subunit release factor 1 (eRF1)